MWNVQSEVESRVPNLLEAITSAVGFTQSEIDGFKLLEGKGIHVQICILWRSL